MTAKSIYQGCLNSSIYAPQGKIIAGMFIFILIICLLQSYLHLNTVESLTVKVESKERITYNHGDKLKSKWIVFTDHEVFENTDSLFFQKFNSADFQSRLKVGQTCTISVVGVRSTLLSSYRNIIEIHGCED